MAAAAKIVNRAVKPDGGTTLSALGSGRNVPLSERRKFISLLLPE